jgi:hypothetical protein
MRSFATALALLSLVASAATAEDGAVSSTDGCEVERVILQSRIADASSKYRSAWFKSGDAPDGTHSGEDQPANVYASIVADLTKTDCYESATKKKIVALVVDIAGLVETLRTRERKCRKNKSCLARRRAIQYAVPLCDLHDERAITVQSIAAERANPTGVVSMRELHDSGRHLQDLDIAIKMQQAEFHSTYKVRFDRKMCAELERDADGNYITPVVLDPA